MLPVCVVIRAMSVYDAIAMVWRCVLVDGGDGSDVLYEAFHGVFPSVMSRLGEVAGRHFASHASISLGNAARDAHGPSALQPGMCGRIQPFREAMNG